MHDNLTRKIISKKSINVRFLYKVFNTFGSSPNKSFTTDIALSDSDNTS